MSQWNPGGGGGPPMGGGGYGGPGGPPPGGGGYGGPPPGGGGYGGPPPGGGFGPPGYGPPNGPPGYGMVPGYGMGGAPPPQLQAKVNLWFILSIVSIFVGCGLFGIINILYANNAKTAMQQGDYATAESKIGTAKTLCIVGFSLFCLMIGAQIILAFVSRGL